MDTTAILQPEIVVDAFPAELITSIERAKLDKETVKAVLEEFAMSVSLSEVSKEVRAIVVTDASQKDLMLAAHDLRIRLRDERNRIEEIREAVKKPYLLKTQAIDGIARIIKNLFKEEEAYLLEQEKFAERAEAKRIADLRDERVKQLEPFGYEGSVEFLGIASPSEFELLLAGARSTHLEKLEDIARRERELKEHAERERLLREDNERLRREKDEADRKVREAEEAAHLEKEESERKVREAEDAARLVREDAERRERERLVAEAAENRRIADEKAKAAAAPDGDKLNAFADAVLALEIPSVSSPDAQKLVERIITAREAWAEKIKAEAKQLRWGDVPF